MSKLKQDKNELEEENFRWKQENEGLRRDNSTLQSTIDSLEDKLKDMGEELEASEEARRNFKINIQDLTDRKIDLEEELY